MDQAQRLPKPMRLLSEVRPGHILWPERALRPRAVLDIGTERWHGQRDTQYWVAQLESGVPVCLMITRRAD
jgi:hypothetical protein